MTQTDEQLLQKIEEDYQDKIKKAEEILEMFNGYSHERVEEILDRVKLRLGEVAFVRI